MTGRTNRKAPRPTKVQGAFQEQLSLIPKPPFCPILPPAHSAAAQALSDLLEGSITQIDWLKRGHGWRLAAAVKELDYLGWCPDSIRVSVGEWARPIALYSLPDYAKQAAYTMRRGDAHAGNE